MKTKKAAIFFLASLMFVAGIQFISCKRPAKPKAIVTVINEENQPVEGARVIVRADSGRVIYLSSGMVLQDTAVTDANGQVSYEFMYEAIYNVKATKLKTTSTGVDLIGTGVLILKEDETYEEKVKIRP